MTPPAVTFELSDQIGILTLNRPDNRNSMTPELLDAFSAATGMARAEPSLRALIVTGRGPSFCGGADLRAAVQRGDGLPHEQSYAMYEPFFTLRQVRVPIIAAVQGHAVGGGFGLALLCDIRIVNAKAKLGANFARLGFHSGMGISYALPRLVGVSRAAELLFTGRLVSGEEAASIGLASAAVGEAEVLPRAIELAREIAASAPIAVRTLKEALYQGLEWDVERAARSEALVQAETLATEDAAEGMRALLEKRPPVFSGR